MEIRLIKQIHDVCPVHLSNVEKHFNLQFKQDLSLTCLFLTLKPWHINWKILAEMMDICRPPVQWIDGRCYRRQEEVEYKVETGYTGEECDELGEDEEGLQHEIVEVQGGRYRAALQIAEPFYGFIIGKGGEGKRRLEAETKTRVQVPKKHRPKSLQNDHLCAGAQEGSAGGGDCGGEE